MRSTKGTYIITALCGAAFLYGKHIGNPDLIYIGGFVFFSFLFTSVLVAVSEIHYSIENFIRKRRTKKQPVKAAVTPTEQKRRANTPGVTLSDVAGYSEIKSELQFVADCMKNNAAKKYGFDYPRGILLYGPPGTGKTYLARAFAGSVNVSFIETSASGFIQTYVGTGAQTINDLYRRALAQAPCVVFIDEIDAIARKRSGGQNEEYRNTINALLSAMSTVADRGYPIVTIAATNAYEDLDPAIIRDGRFDKKLLVDFPNDNERQALIKMYFRGTEIHGIRMSELINLTRGHAAANIKKLANEAKANAFRAHRNVVNRDDILNVLSQNQTNGKEINISGMKDEQFILPAYHESGHILCYKLLCNSFIPKASVIPSTSGELGMTLHTEPHSGVHTKTEMENLIKALYAGTICESFVLSSGEKTNGARGDISQATELIKQYIRNNFNDSAMHINAEDFQGGHIYVEQEAQKLSLRLYKEAESYLISHKYYVRRIAEELIKHKTLDDEAISRIIRQCQQDIRTGKANSRDN